MRHIALFSQTGSEIANLIERGISPDVILSDQKDSSMIDSRLSLTAESQILKNDVKSVEYLRDCFGDPSTCYITLHGWLNIIPREICQEYDIYNGHPGLITEFECLKGKDPQVRAFNGNYNRIGAVIHCVTPGVDEGRVVLSHGIKNTCTTLDEVFNTLKDISLNLWLDFFDRW